MNTNTQELQLIQYLARKVDKLKAENEQLKKEIEEKITIPAMEYHLVKTSTKVMKCQNYSMALNILKQALEKEAAELKSFNTLSEMNEYISKLSFEEAEVKKKKKILAVETDFKVIFVSSLSQALSVKKDHSKHNSKIIDFESRQQRKEYIANYVPKKDIMAHEQEVFNRLKKIATDKGYNHFFYVDASTNKYEKLFSAAFVLEVDGEYTKEQYFTFKEEKANGHSIALSGEFTAAMLAVIEAKKMGLTKFAIVYDNVQIYSNFLSPQKNVKLGISFHEWMKRETKGMEIEFIKAKSHAGIEGNEKVDQLAKKAISQPRKIYA